MGAERSTSGRHGGVVVLAFVIAAAARIAAGTLEAAYIHPDALHQALEPAFRLLHGHGHVAWEFEQGLRSWSFPGLLAGAMACGELLGGAGAGTTPGLAGVTVCVAILDVVGLLAWAQLAACAVPERRRDLVVAAVLLAGSVHPLTVLPGSQPLVVIPAGTLLAWTARWGLAGAQPSWGPMCGAAMATALLRPQLAPAVLAVALFAGWRARPDRAQVRRGTVAAGAVALAFGGLDALTWGEWWGSTVRYLEFSLSRSDEVFGRMPAGRYAEHLAAALGVPGLVALGTAAVVGGSMAPRLALVIAAVVVPHQLVGQKQLHFLHPALMGLVALAVTGVLVRGRRALLVGVGVAWLACAAEAWWTERYFATTWLHHQGGAAAVERSRGLDLAYREISRGAAPRRVVQAVLPGVAAPGHALLGHDVEELHVLDAAAPVEPRAGDVLVAPAPPAQAALPAGAVAWRGRDVVIVHPAQLP